MRRAVVVVSRALRSVASKGTCEATGPSNAQVAASAVVPAAARLACHLELVQFVHAAAERPTDVQVGEESHAAQPHRHHVAPTPAETGGPMAKYQAGLQSGLYRPDPRQELTIQMLQELYADLQRAASEHHLAGQPQHGSSRPRRRPSGLTIVDYVGTAAASDGPSTSSSSSSRGGFGGLSWLSGFGFGGSAASSSSGRGGGGVGSGSAADAPPAVRGLYMYGGVGCGKTMLMDLFVDTAPKHFKVLRTHFHDFMLEVHAALRTHARTPEPLAAVADGIAARCRTLALDELFVTDVADAMIVNRLFGRLWERGVVLVATSNRPPDELYKGGLQRNLFMPFIHRLKVQCRPHDMASATDYRRLAQRTRGLYFVEPGAAGAAASRQQGQGQGQGPQQQPLLGADQLSERFLELAGAGAVGGGGGGAPAPAPARVEVMMGRELEVPLAAGKVCLFPFPALCGRPVAAADYLALTTAYHTLALRGVPRFGAANRSEAYRFATLIDVLYEARTRLLVTAEAPPVDLFANVITQFDAAKEPDFAAQPDVVVDDNLGFAKDRTISRLTEMQSLEYLLHHAREHEPGLVLALQEAQAKSKAAAGGGGAQGAAP